MRPGRIQTGYLPWWLCRAEDITSGVVGTCPFHLGFGSAGELQEPPAHADKTSCISTCFIFPATIPPSLFYRTTHGGGGGPWEILCLGLIDHLDTVPHSVTRVGHCHYSGIIQGGESQEGNMEKGKKIVSLWRRKTKQNKSLPPLYSLVIWFNISLNKITKSERF